MGENGIETGPEKVGKKPRSYPRPINPQELRSFLDLAGYYRKVVKTFFRKVGKPLSDMLPYTSPKENRKRHQIKN